MVMPMSDKQETEVMTAVAESIRLANDGLDPSEAIAKKASDHGFNGEFAARMVEAFNVSKTLKHHKEAAGDARAAEFPLADAEKVLLRMFPAEVAAPKTVKDSAWVPAEAETPETRFYSLEHEPAYAQVVGAAVRPDWERPYLDTLMKQAYAEVKASEAVAEADHECQVAELESLCTSVTKLADYFKTAGHEPFENVEAAALATFGDSARPVLDIVWERSRAAKLGEKRATTTEPRRVYDIVPYELMQSIMDAAPTCATTAQAWAKSSAHAQKFRTLIDDCGRTIKAGAGASMMSGALADSAIAQAITKKSPSAYETLVSAIEELGDPAMETERKSIRARMLLRDLMSRDEVLKHAPPQSVLSAYNDIATLAPTAVESPVALLTLLRKHVEQGQLAPEDVSTIIEIEKGTRGLSELKVPELTKEVILGSADTGSKPGLPPMLGRAEKQLEQGTASLGGSMGSVLSGLPLPKLTSKGGPEKKKKDQSL